MSYSAIGFAKYAPGGLKWGPSVLGLACIPFMPYFDEPVEEFIDDCFLKYVPPAFPKKVGGNPEQAQFKR